MAGMGFDRENFERFAGTCALLTAVAGFLYTIAFALLARVTPDLGLTLSWALLLVGGILAIPALIAVYRRLRQAHPDFALLGLILAVAGALGSIAHGGYEVAIAFHPPAARPTDLPNPLDPRGLFTFGLAGLGLFVLAWLMARGGTFPRRLGLLGYVSAALLVLIYLGRLIVLEATSPLILVPAALEGFIVNPLWYGWLGLELRRARTA
jgi:hypothetical protein